MSGLSKNPGAKSGKRGGVDNEKRLAGLGAALAGRGAVGWGSASPEKIAAVVVAATKLGAAVSFSLSRDGGAHGLTIFANGEKTSLWFNGDADLDECLEGVLAVLDTY